MIAPAKSQNINWGAREQLSHRNTNKHREFVRFHWNLMEDQASPTTAQLLLSQCLCLGRIFPSWPRIPFWLRMQRDHPATLAKPPCLRRRKKNKTRNCCLVPRGSGGKPCSSLARRAGTSGVQTQKVHKASCTEEKGLKKWSGRTEIIYFLGRSNCVQMISFVQLKSFFLSLLRNVKGWTAWQNGQQKEWEIMQFIVFQISYSFTKRLLQQAEQNTIPLWVG